MKSRFIFFAFLFTNTFLFAQSDNLIGHWDFHKIQTTEALDAETLSALNGMFSNVVFEFKNDATYTSQLMKRTISGTWKVENDQIAMQSSAGKGEKIKFLQTHKDTLRLELDANQYMVLKRGTMSTNTVEAAPAKPKTEPVVADRNKVVKKWYLIRKTIPNRTKEQLDMVASMLKGAYFEFKKDGKYNVEILTIKDKGTWNLSDAKTEIIQLREDGSSTTWRIVKLNDDELILSEGDSEDQYIYSAKKPS